VPLAVLPACIGLGGPLYALSSSVLGAIFLTLTVQVLRRREGRRADRAAKRLFTFSIVYLFSLFATLLLERGIALWSV
jgi:protoheme IX farnesyltransferase